MENRKLGKATDKRMALLRSQVTDLLWHGRIETTVDRAKEVQKIAEKLLTKAVNSYKDTVKNVETRQRKKKDKKGNVTVEESLSTAAASTAGSSSSGRPTLTSRTSAPSSCCVTASPTR